MKLIIVDDDRIVVEALKTIVSQDGEISVCATGHSAGEAVSLYRAHRPDVLLMDIRMGEVTGLDAAEEILSEFPDARILFLTTFSDHAYVLRAMEQGAKGYLLKQDYEGILPALKAVASGQTVYGSEITQALPRLMREGVKDPLQGLSPRERELLPLVAEGMSNREIAGRLFLSEGTVRNLVSSVLQKLDQRDRTQLALYYHKLMNR